MRLGGRIVKTNDRVPYAVEIPALEVFTQGRTLKEAYLMAKDAVETLVGDKTFEVRVYADKSDNSIFTLAANRPGQLLQLMLERQRKQSGQSLSETAKKLGQVSKNAYKQYENGSRSPSLGTLAELLKAVGKDLVVSVVEHEKKKNSA